MLVTTKVWKVAKSQESDVTTFSTAYTEAQTERKSHTNICTSLNCCLLWLCDHTSWHRDCNYINHAAAVWRIYIMQLVGDTVFHPSTHIMDVSKVCQHIWNHHYRWVSSFVNHHVNNELQTRLCIFCHSGILSWVLHPSPSLLLWNHNSGRLDLILWSSYEYTAITRQPSSHPFTLRSPLTFL